MTTHTIEVIGKDARRRVLEALSKSFPTSTAKVGGQVLKSIHNSQETNKMTNQQEALMAELDKGMTALEAEIDGLLKQQSRRRPVDDWSDTPTGNANAAADDGDDDDDGGDYGDELDDEDDEDTIGKQTKFMALSNNIKNTEKCSATEADQRARTRFPRIFQSHQESVAKSTDYNSLVRREIAKGVNRTVAQQRIQLLFPDASKTALAKSDHAGDVAGFMSACDEQMATSGCSRTEAMSLVRKSRPDLFGRLRNV